jgi:dihydroorotate dehydrogenase electron transfer subunit
LSDYHIVANEIRAVRITSVSAETPWVKSFTFNDELCSKAKPGQFVMIWIPGVDEIPMSLSMLSPRKGQAAVTAERIGEATNALHKMITDDRIGVRGPFGNCYTLSRSRKVLIVGGGTGLASLAPLTERLVKQRAEITFLMGAKTRRHILFHRRVNNLISKAKGNLIVTTEDGSFGQKGLVTTQVEKLLKRNREFDMIYTCGPEKMMQKTFLLAEKFHVPLEASLERFMRCAIGLCGTCVIGRYRVCQDGPVFSSRQLREAKEEFGQWRRAFDGRKTKI